MAIARWNPKQELSKKKERLVRRSRARKLIPFLRRHRHEIFSDDFQAELEG